VGPSSGNAPDYRDYFISGGRHVGDYEGMYRDCEDPWRIEELGVRLDMRAALLLLEAGPPSACGPGGALRALDAGAGAGLFSLEVLRTLGRRFARVEMSLNDVSPTALAKARARFAAAGAPEPALVPYDLRLLAGDADSGDLHPPPGGPEPPFKGPEPPFGGHEPSLVSPEQPPGGPEQPCGGQGSRAEGPFGPFGARSFDLIVLAQSLWGIVEEVDGVLAAFRGMLDAGGLLLVSQHFPGEARQQWGRRITGPEGFAGALGGASFKLLAELETDRSSNHHWGSLWRRA
jgi:SAM-dependent methyltransferase